MIFFKFHVTILDGDEMMKALLCKIAWMERYHGEDIETGCQLENSDHEKSNFINFEGTYYGYLHTQDLTPLIKEHHTKYPYVIFYATHPQKGNKIVGWYKEALVFRDEQLFDPECPYFVRARDENVVLLASDDRRFSIRVDDWVSEIEIDRSLQTYLRHSRRINYRHSDLQISSTMNLPSLHATCEFIEKAMMEENGLMALQLVNKGMMTYGKLASLIYYKAWILYSFNQFRRASILLYQIKDVPELHEFACYMLGNIYFQICDYEMSISCFKEVKHVNQDECYYMLAQAYAMESDVGMALNMIKKALSIQQLDVYKTLYQELLAWSQDTRR